MSIRLDILEDFESFQPGVAYGEVGVNVRGPRQRNHFYSENQNKRFRLRWIDRQLRAARQPPPEIKPLPRVRCGVCGLEFGTIKAMRVHISMVHCR